MCSFCISLAKISRIICSYDNVNFVFRALEDRKKEQQDNEEQIREEVLARRKQEQQEATQRFQKDTVHKKKLKTQVDGTDKGVCC